VADGSGYVPAVGQDVGFWDGDTRVFGGTIESFTRKRLGARSSPVIEYSLAVSSQERHADKRIIESRSYQSTTAGSIVADILARELALEALSGTIGPGADITSIVFDHVTCAEAFNQLANLSNFLGGQLCGAMMLASRVYAPSYLRARFSRWKQTKRGGVPSVAARRYPLQILDSVVGLHTVLVVHAMAALGRITEEGKRDETVNLDHSPRSVGPCPDSYDHVPIRIEDRTYEPAGADDSPVVRDLVSRVYGALAPLFPFMGYDQLSHRRVSSCHRDSGGQRSPAVSAAVGLARHYSTGMVQL
jgi:hypothetical protein